MSRGAASLDGEYVDQSDRASVARTLFGCMQGYDSGAIRWQRNASGSVPASAALQPCCSAAFSMPCRRSLASMNSSMNPRITSAVFFSSFMRLTT